MAKKTKSYREANTGANLQEQYGEASLTVVSPRSRRMITLASNAGKLDLPFVKKAIQRALVNDGLEFVRNKSSIVTIENMLSAGMKGSKQTINDFEENEILKIIEDDLK